MYLNAIQLVKLATYPLIGMVVLHRMMKLVLVLLMSQILRNCPLDPFSAMLLYLLTFRLHDEGVHLRLVPHKLLDRFSVRLILEFADDLVVGVIVERAEPIVRRKVESALILTHLGVDVVGFNMIHQGVGVGEEKLRLREFLLEVLVVESRTNGNGNCKHVKKTAT